MLFIRDLLAFINKGLLHFLLAFCSFFFFPLMAFAQGPFNPSSELKDINIKAQSTAPWQGYKLFNTALEFYCKTLRPPRAPQLPVTSAPAAWLGVSIEAIRGERLPLAKAGDLSYARVVLVAKGSPADLAGLKEGDLILKINDNEVASPQDLLFDKFAEVLEKNKVGDLAKLEVLRDGKLERFEARLARRPKFNLELKQHQEIDCQDNKEASILQTGLEGRKLAEPLLEVSHYLDEGAEFVHYIDRSSGSVGSPGRRPEVTFLLKNPFKTLPAVALMAERLAAGANSKGFDLATFFDAGFSYLDYETAPSMGRRISPIKKPAASDMNLPPAIGNFVKIIISAGEHIQAAFSKLSISERVLLRSYIEKFLSDDFPSKGHEVFAPEEFNHFADLSKKVDFNSVRSAARMVFSALSMDKINLLIEEARTLESTIGVRGDGLVLYEDSPFGKIVVGGSGRNIYTEDAALIIDLGGDDLYRNNGGASTDSLPISIVIDAAGNDTYIGTGIAGQGAGAMGIGALMDLNGNDYYYHLNSGQGLGAFGAGALIDLKGDDYYQAGRFGQGSGFYGAGLLFDAAGEDIYKVDAIGQGTGGPAGLGALIDSSGNDRYESGSRYRDFRDPENSFDSMAQGFGFGLRPRGEYVDLAGGIGLLIDASGDDIYVGDYFAQGSAYWYALGALIDGAGDDTYVSGRYAQGVGVHYAVGALLDYSGSDSYIARFGVAQGAGHDRAFGLLFDGSGADSYFGGRMSQGLGNANGLGVLVDAKGSDIYSASSPGQGWGLKYQRRGSFGILLDIGPGDNMFGGSAAASPSIERGEYGLSYVEGQARK